MDNENALNRRTENENALNRRSGKNGENKRNRKARRRVVKNKKTTRIFFSRRFFCRWFKVREEKTENRRIGKTRRTSRPRDAERKRALPTAFEQTDDLVGDFVDRLLLRGRVRLPHFRDEITLARNVRAAVRRQEERSRFR